ncbi:hypothetical protein U1Q18_037794 [Sarracenia purpurea var. burkii]
MAMVGGIYGSRGDDSFVISDYGVPTQVIVLVFRVSTGRRWFSHWIFGYSLFSGRNSFWKQASRSDVKVCQGMWGSPTIQKYWFSKKLSHGDNGDSGDLCLGDLGSSHGKGWDEPKA